MSSDGSIAIAGAGSIGCFVGGWLAANGRDVALLARPRTVEQIAAHGLRLTSFDGAAHSISAQQITLSADPSLLARAAFILVTVKSGDTAAMADLVARHGRADAVIVSLQNGIGNAAILRDRLGARVRAGMVPFNVIAAGKGRFHRSTSGDIHIEHDETGTAARLSVPGLSIRGSADIAGLQWGKLLINLNNALNALSGLPLREQLSRRPWRALFADQMSEALAAMSAAKISPRSPTPIPPRWMPPLLRLPDAAFNLLLGRTMQIDAAARSSMWEDLTRGRRTEIDYLQGEIIALAERNGLDAPLCRRVLSLIKAAEARGDGPPGLVPEDIRS